MELREADKIFAAGARTGALAKLLGDKSCRRISLEGLAGSAPSMLFAGMEPLPHPAVIIADDITAAGYLYNDLCRIAGDDAAELSPSGYRRDIKYGQQDPPSQILRTEVLDRLKGKTPPRWVVTCPEALAEKVADAGHISENSLTVTAGSRMNMSDLVKRLLELGFNTTEYVYEPGQFARRGSIIDVWSFAGELPYRIDFFDDEIDSIRVFNVETQLSDDTVLFCQSPSFVTERIKAIAAETYSESATIADEGDPDSMSKVVDAEAFTRRMLGMKIVKFGPSEAGAVFTPDATMRFECSPQVLYHKNFNLISESFTKFLSEGYRILILSDSVHQTDRLRSIFEDRGDRIEFTPVEHTIHEGFVDHATKTCFFTDHQIFDRFHKYNLKSDRARSGKMSLTLKEIRQFEPGDYVVHVDHGIGRFGGLVRMPQADGGTQEMIKIQYLNGDSIYVSIHSLYKVSKYKAQDNGEPPRLSHLGTGQWERLKERTKKKLKDIARDLIKLYAQRRQEQGFAFSPDCFMQHELEASFLYEDTPDQLKATNDVKADMERRRPMDRLVCGDVGFGKTEVAVRAAFKAACDSKQVAVLVPTTVLAYQHYQTFSKRLKDFPVRVDYLTRARSAKQTKELLKDLEDGKIDILIGTHKLIGKSVKFRDLGLLIIDEEQKFGVAARISSSSSAV